MGDEFVGRASISAQQLERCCDAASTTVQAGCETPAELNLDLLDNGKKLNGNLKYVPLGRLLPLLLS